MTQFDLSNFKISSFQSFKNIYEHQPVWENYKIGYESDTVLLYNDYVFYKNQIFTLSRDSIFLNLLINTVLSMIMHI